MKRKVMHSVKKADMHKKKMDHHKEKAKHHMDKAEHHEKMMHEHHDGKRHMKKYKVRKLVRLGKKEDKIDKVMHEFKEGMLHSGSKKGPVVKGRRQAIAIALSESRRKTKKRS